MSKRIVRLFLLTLLFCAASAVAFSQSKQELEKRKKELNKEIEQTTKVLKDTQVSKKNTLNQLMTLNRQIAIRENLINTISSEVRLLESQINEINKEIETLRAELQQLKKEYASMVRFAFRNQSSYNKLMFVFAAENFNQAYKRLKYLQQFSEYRKKQAEYIEAAQLELLKKMEELEKNKKVKNNLLIEEQSEKVTLGKEKEQQQKMANSLQAKEKTLKKQLADKQAQAKKLDRAIQDIIRREIEAARKKAEAEAKAKGTKPATSSSGLALTPEAQKLSNEFTSNRGKLPWPVEKGIIIEYFGTHEHPVLKGVMVQNNGIDIKTTAGAQARAIFSGVVSEVIQIPGGQNVVLIRHGEYLSVYSNLRTVSVKKGQHISTKQSIGVVNTEDDLSSIELQIWKEVTKLNPVDWLAR